jgi:hypothetical protein
VRYCLIRASIDFPYPGVQMEAPQPGNVPAELYAAEPPPPTEAEGNTRHLHFWSPVDPRWDEQRHTVALHTSIELQGHVVSAIRLAVIRISGQPDQQQQRMDELAQQRQVAIMNGSYARELD